MQSPGFPTVAAASLLAMAAAVTTGLGSSWSSHNVENAIRWVSHTHEVQAAVQEVLSLLQEAETGERGYLLTGDPSYLEPLESAAPSVAGRIAALQHLTADNPSQQRRLQRLQVLAAEKMQRIEQSVASAHAGHRERSVALLDEGRGKAVMDAARTEIAAMQSEEGRLLGLRLADVDRARERTAATAALTTGLLLALIAIVYASSARATARVRAALAASEASKGLVQAVIDGATPLVFAKDLNGRYFLTNRAWREVAGVAPGQADGATDAQVFGDAVARRLAETDREVVRRGEPLLTEEGAVVRGRRATFLSSKFPLRTPDGQVYAVCGVSTDITELKMAREEVQRLNADLEQRVVERTRQLSEANQQLEAFSYTVSHDLRAPLRGVQGFAQAVMEDYADRLDTQGRDYLARILAGARRMEGLIQDLLEYGRLSREQLPLRDCSLELAVQEALAQLAPEIEARQASVQVQPPLPPVRGHPAVLQQILGNLLGNALKFVAPGERPQVRVWAERREGRVRTFVQDHGIGIRPEHQARIFDMFERLHGQEAFAGTGVGLAIVRKATERLGGTCGVGSVPGRGSTFWFELQAASP